MVIERGDYMNLKLLRMKRLQNELSQKQLAEMIGVHEMTYFRKEKGEREFTRTEIDNLAKALNLSNDDVNEIFFDSRITNC